jgi:signal transduction histidine kinase
VDLRRRSFLDSFATRVLATCGVVLAVLLVASLRLHDALLARAAERGTMEIVVQRLASVVEALAAAPPADRPGIARALAAPDLDVRWGLGPLVPLEEMATSGSALAPPERLSEVAAEVHVTSGGTDPEQGVLRWVGITARLHDGSWVDARLATVSLLAANDQAFHAAIAAIAAALFVVAGLAAHAISAPLARLARAVDRIVPGGEAALPAIRGPPEVRHVAEALDAMAGRVRDVLRQRSLVLAALSHDLMSPVARLKLRADELPDEAVRRAFLRDLAEMETMVTDALAFLRGGDDGEQAVPVSVAALVQVVVDEFLEVGEEVEERRLEDATVRARPVALKRALRNLIGNALRHAREPWVEVGVEGAAVLIQVGDRGPGLPPAERERAFEPFFRGDRARAAGGGSGLGLPTARAIAEAHGGSLELAAAPGGGTVARLRLPRHRGGEAPRRDAPRT